MVGFVALTIDDVYRTSSHRIGKDLYGILLPQATHYSRAAGFFSSSAFRVAPDGFLAYFRKGCRMDLVCSRWLGEEDLQAMSRAVLERPRVRASSKLEQLSSSGDSAKPWPDLVSYLIAYDLLRVRIAITPQKSIGSLYHEKSRLLFRRRGACRRVQRKRERVAQRPGDQLRARRRVCQLGPGKGAAPRARDSATIPGSLGQPNGWTGGR
jgi:hypothetical protein